MEVTTQTCRYCGSQRHEIIIARAVGQLMMIFSRCADCGELVAAYEVSRFDTSGEHADAWLRSIGGEVAESGRRILGDAERFRELVLEWYPKVLAHRDAFGDRSL